MFRYSFCVLLLCATLTGYAMAEEKKHYVSDMVFNQFEDRVLAAENPAGLLKALESYGVLKNTSTHVWELESQFPNVPFRAIKATEMEHGWRIDLMLRQPTVMGALTCKVNSWMRKEWLPDSGAYAFTYSSIEPDAGFVGRLKCSYIPIDRTVDSWSPLQQITCFWRSIAQIKQD